VLLFGRVPEDRQIYLSGVAFGSVRWLIALVGVAFPGIGAFLVSFVSPPDWVKPWIRIAMLVAVVIIPALVGWLSTRMVEIRRTGPRRCARSPAAIRIRSGSR